MALTTDSPLQRQVTRVRRRLFLQTLVRALIWSWVGALALSAVWFLLQPLLIHDAPYWLRWTVLGGAVVVGTGVAATIAVMRKPSPVQAALALDEQFQLKERVTTSLMLRPDEAASSAGAALLADANQRVDPLRIGDRFPVRIPWTAMLVPAGAGVVALLAFFYNPTFGQAHDEEKQTAASNAALKADIDKKMQQLLNNRPAKKPEEALKSAELKKIEADIDKMVNSPHETKDQVQEQIKHADDLLEEIKKQDKERADEARALKEQLQQMERAQKQKEDFDKKQDGPAKDLEKALGQGDLQKAKDEADELAKKLDDDQKAKDEADELKKKLDDDKDKLKPEEKQELQDELKKKQDEQLGKDDREKLEQQLKDMKDEADELTRKTEEEEKKNEEDQKKLEDEAKKDEKSQDELQREKEQLKKESDQLKQQQQDLKNLSQNLGQAQQAMKEGKDGQAAQQMKEAGQQMAKMDGQGERKELAQDKQQVQQVKKALSQALAKQDGQQGQQGNKPGDQPGNQPGNKAGDQGKGDGQGPSGPNQGGQGSGAREESADAKTGEVDTQVHSDPDENAKLQIVDHVPGAADRFKGAFKPADNVDEIRKAAQEGAAASERERLTDKETAEMARGFFEKMRPPDKDDKKPAPKP